MGEAGFLLAWCDQCDDAVWVDAYEQDSVLAGEARLCERCVLQARSRRALKKTG